MAGRYTVECRSPRIAICLFHHRIGPRVDDGGVLWPGGDVRPASSRLDAAAGAGNGSRRPLAAADYRGVRHHGHQRRTLVLRHTATVLSEHLLPIQNAAVAA